MKKVLMSLSLVAFLAVTVSSCLKNDSTPSAHPQDPELERDTISGFNSSMGYHMIEVTDSLGIFYFNEGERKYSSANIYMPYIQYEIVEQGDMGPGTIEMSDADLGGDLSGNPDITVYNTLSDTTLIFSCTYKGTLLNGETFDETKDGKPIIQAITRLIYPWQALIRKVGRGGHIRFVTPSAYAYGATPQQGIPINSPLFFDVYVKGFIKNDYGK